MSNGAADPLTPRLGVWSSLGEPRVAVELGRTGFDWVCLDAQHGIHDDRTVRETIERRRDGDAPIVVRVLDNSPAHIGRALDAGADGVIVPMVQDGEQARAAVAATHHPPLGTRSFGPTGGIRYPDRPFCAVMIETAEALERVDEIASTPELDMIFLGPFDLSLALGRNVDELVADHGESAPLPTVLRACRRAGILSGTYAGNPNRGRVLREHGFDWMAITSDVDLLHAGAASALEVMAAGAVPPVADHPA
ncbi:HpcH/HpaI aldolase family protein [Actinomycetota bacterium]